MASFCAGNQAPPPPSSKTIIFSEDELQQLQKDVDSESSTSLFARIHGCHPSRLQARDWMLAALPSDLASSIVDVRLLGRGFF